MARRSRAYISPTGMVGINTPVGNGAAGASVNPVTGSAGVSAASPVGGDSSVSISAGVNPVKGTYGITPKVQIGSGEAAGLGGSAGSLAGGVIAGPPGSAIGSAVGSASGDLIDKDPKLGGAALIAGGPAAGASINAGRRIAKGVGKIFGGGGGNKEHKDRNGVRDSFTKAGFYPSDGMFTLPDGTVANLNDDSTHNWVNPNKRVDNSGDRSLYDYETDYTNDLDYLASMGGISLSRLLAGQKNKAVDQEGQRLGNKSLGKVGYGGDLNQDNFNTVMTNMKAMYSQGGIKSKEEMLGLANKAYADGRINDSDVAVMNQTANMMFNNDYNQATSLMSNRWPGMKTAAGGAPKNQQVDPGHPQPYKNRPGIFAPNISSAEALASIQPFLGIYRESMKEGYNQYHRGQLDTASSLAGGIGIASGIYNIANKVTGGAVGDALGGILKNVGGSIRGLYDDIVNPPTSDAVINAAETADDYITY